MSQPQNIFEMSLVSSSLVPLKQAKLELRRAWVQRLSSSLARIQPLISILHNPIQHDQTKDKKVDKHFIKEKLENKLIYTPYVST